MTGAMYAAIGGLKSHMSNLNVIGNNIANVNTYGYKAARMTFQESIYITSRAGSNGGATSGGNNPSQVGYGCSVGSIDLNMSPSTYAPTGVGLDCMIQGEGFFLVGDKDGNIMSNSDVSRLQLSRVGNFWQDPDGYICDRYGQVVYGFATVQNPNYVPNPTDAQLADADEKGIDIRSKTVISTQLVPLRVPLSAAAPTADNGGYIPAEGEGDDATPEVYNWNEGDPVYPYLEQVTQNGKTYQRNVYATYQDDAAEFDEADDAATEATDGSLGLGSTMAVPGQNTDPNRVSNELICQLKEMSVEKNGAIIGTASNGDTVVIGYIAIANVDSPDGVTHVDGPYYKCQGGAGCLRVSALGGVLEGKYLGNQQLELDEDGNVVGTAPDPSDGIVNEKSVEIRNGGLESSSTDIATEFTGLITTQRGYQANTRIITVTDSMLEELVNMKR